jgi:hypothetical protein
MPQKTKEEGQKEKRGWFSARSCFPIGDGVPSANFIFGTGKRVDAFV